jgi:hypothetical protein
MQQLLIHAPAPDYAAWKSSFDAQAESLAAAGLSPLQIWIDESGNAVVLLQVNSRPKAEDWLASRNGLGDQITARFLKTV